MRRLHECIRWWCICSFVSLSLAACGGEERTPTDVNLLVNPSFEEVEDGLPRGWELTNFRGLSTAKVVEHGIDDTQASDGERSFRFAGDKTTKRYVMLTQEVEVNDVDRVTVTASVKTNDVRLDEGNYVMAGLALTFYDKDHLRFQSETFYDARTRPAEGTSDWKRGEASYRLPAGTRYVALHCVFSMSGEIWFDDVSLVVPAELPWLTESEGEVFTHYYLPGAEYPDGSIEFQDRLYEQYAKDLGIPREAWRHIDYYLYPDTTTIFETLGVREAVQVFEAQRQIHSIHPANDHEIIHLLTDPYGTLPMVMHEGLAFYLMDDWHGQSIQPLAQELLLSNRIPRLTDMLEMKMARMVGDPKLVMVPWASFVGYLIEFGGSERFLDFIRSFGPNPKGTDIPKKFEEIYGAPFDTAEMSWRATLKSADFSAYKNQEAGE